MGKFYRKPWEMAWEIKTFGESFFIRFFQTINSEKFKFWIFLPFIIVRNLKKFGFLDKTVGDNKMYHFIKFCRALTVGNAMENFNAINSDRGPFSSLSFSFASISIYHLQVPLWSLLHLKPKPFEFLVFSSSPQSYDSFDTLNSNFLYSLYICDIWYCALLKLCVCDIWYCIMLKICVFVMLY